MRRLATLMTLALIVVLSACNLWPTPITITTVEGTVLDKYTHRPLVGIKVMVRTWRYGLGTIDIDSVASTFTNADGNYQLSFDATVTGVTYRLDIKGGGKVYDLTDYSKYDQYAYTDGPAVSKGKANKVFFEAVSYVPVKIDLDLNKLGNSFLQISFAADERDQQGYFAGKIIEDTARSNQRIIVNIVRQFVPNRFYTFRVYQALSHCVSTYQCQASNVSSQTLTRRVLYNDTTVIKFRQ